MRCLDEFGFGLTYTTFAYSDLNICLAKDASTTSLPPDPTNIIQGGIASLWDTIYTVTARITNTGKVTASEVAQCKSRLFHNQTSHDL